MKDFWLTIVNNDLASVTKIDQQTVEKLQLMAPRAEPKDVQGLVLSGQAFANFDERERTAIWERLRLFNGLVPSLYSFFEDFKCFESWAHCLTRLFTLKRPTVQSTMNSLWTDSDNGDGMCLVQTSESAFSRRAEPVGRHFDVAYRHIWLYVMRHYPQMPREPKRKNRLAKPANATADEYVVFDMACLARRLGFQSPEITDLGNQSPDRKIAMQALLQARRPDNFVYEESALDSLVNTVAGCFTMARRKDVVAPSPILVSRSVKQKTRCGHPTMPALQQDRPLLFLDSLHAEEVPDKVTTFFVRRCVYFAFFGPQPSFRQEGVATTAATPLELSMSPLFEPADSPSGLQGDDFASQMPLDDAHGSFQQRSRESSGLPSAIIEEREEPQNITAEEGYQALDVSRDGTSERDALRTAAGNTQQEEDQGPWEHVAENTPLPAATEDLHAALARRATRIDLSDLIARRRKRRSKQIGSREYYKRKRPQQTGNRKYLMGRRSELMPLRQRRQSKIKSRGIRNSQRAKSKITGQSATQQADQGAGMTTRYTNEPDARIAAEASELERPSDANGRVADLIGQPSPANETQVAREQRINNNEETTMQNVDDVDESLLEMLQNNAEHRALGEQSLDSRARLGVQTSDATRDTGQEESVARERALALARLQAEADNVSATPQADTPHAETSRPVTRIDVPGSVTGSRCLPADAYAEHEPQQKTGPHRTTDRTPPLPEATSCRHVRFDSSANNDSPRMGKGASNATSRDRPSWLKTSNSRRLADNTPTDAEPALGQGSDRILITFYIYKQGQWDVADALQVERSRTSDLQRAVRRYKQRDMVLYDMKMRTVSVASSFRAATADGANALFVR